MLLSLFIREPQFQGQTKEKLATAEATRLVEATIKDHFDHWLSGRPRARRRSARPRHRAGRGAPAPQAGQGAGAQDRDPQAAPARQARRLHAATAPQGTEIFLVEGDSAGGSAKQARDRETQAVLPLRGKILNVASASTEKLAQNQELIDLIQALGCGTRDKFDEKQAALRARHHHDRRRCRRRPYRLAADDLLLSRDAGADRERPSLPGPAAALSPEPGRHGHLCPRRRAQGRADEDDLHRQAARSRSAASRAWARCPPPSSRRRPWTGTSASCSGSWCRTATPRPTAAEHRETSKLVESLMGRKPELRFAFIQEHAKLAQNLDV